MTEWMRLELTDREGPRSFNGSDSQCQTGGLLLADGQVELNFKCQLLALWHWTGKPRR